MSNPTLQPLTAEELDEFERRLHALLTRSTFDTAARADIRADWKAIRQSLTQQESVCRPGEEPPSAPSKQVFGYTEPGQAAPNEYVRFLAVFECDGGDFRVEVRNSAGVTNSITIPATVTGELGVSFLQDGPELF